MAKQFNGIVKFYTKGELNMTINFPENEVYCYWCNFCRSDNMNRAYCSLTHEFLFDVNVLSDRCPISFKEGCNNGNN